MTARSKRGGVSARNYVLHIDPSTTWMLATMGRISLISGEPSSRVRCGRPSAKVNRAGTGAYNTDELCRKCWDSAKIDAEGHAL